MRIKDIIAVVILAILCLFLAYEAYTAVHWWEWLFIIAIIICLGLQIVDYFRYRKMSPAEIAKITRKKRSPRGENARRRQTKAPAKKKRSNRRASDERRGIRPPQPEEMTHSAKKADPGGFLTSLHAMDAQEEPSADDVPAANETEAENESDEPSQTGKGDLE